MLNIALEESKDPFGIKLILSRYGINVCISYKEEISDVKTAINSLALGCRRADAMDIGIWVTLLCSLACNIFILQSLRGGRVGRASLLLLLRR